MIVKFHNVSLIRNGKYILKDINWTIKKGEHWAILGLNGAGKTMLLNLLNGYIFPSKGSLEVLGKTIGKYDMRELRKSIGWVSSSMQEKFHNYSTVLDIILSGKFATVGLYDDASDEDISLAKEIANLLHISNLNHREYMTLSQGEKQRVLVARGLMSQPDLLILDEPCTGLDLIAREKLFDIIKELCNMKNAPAMIYVTHHTEEILPSFSNTLLLRRGQVHTEGSTDMVLTEEILSDFYETPIRYEKSDDRVYLWVTG